jgi:hypothetical protein
MDVGAASQPPKIDHVIYSADFAFRINVGLKLFPLFTHALTEEPDDQLLWHNFVDDEQP